MNKILLSVVLSLILLVPYSVYATQFIPYIGFAYDHTPSICIEDNTEREHYQDVTKKSVKAWQDELNYLTHNRGNWNMTVNVVDRVKEADCNIVFIYDLKKLDWEQSGSFNGKPQLGRELGVTACNPVGDSDIRCTINIHALYMTDDSVLQVTEHEFGHALGLGHRMADNPKDGILAFLSDDLMFWQYKKFSHLTTDDALALIHLYGWQGFGNAKEIPDHYEITHPTRVPVYCNGINSTGGICVNVVGHK